jgi:Rrf2 family protein
MTHLARQEKGIVVSRKEIAEATDTPSQFLAKIAQDLSKAGFIEIRQGTKGGFILIRSAETITLLDVVESIMGEIVLNDCVVKPGSCRISGECAVYRVWVRARRQLRDTLREANFADLAEQKGCQFIQPLEDLQHSL